MSIMIYYWYAESADIGAWTTETTNLSPIRCRTMTVDTPPAPGSDDTHIRQYRAGVPDQPLTAIVEAVSAVKGVDVRELDPIYYAIDIEQLNRLAGGKPSGGHEEPTEPDRAKLTVTFEYEGCQITVGDERVSVTRT